MQEHWQRGKANNARYQFFNQMSNEQLLDWLNTVAVSAGHQEEMDIIRNWILAERGYDVVDVPGAHWSGRYRLEPLAKD